MKDSFIIRPLSENEFVPYFQMRYKQAKIHNPKLISKIRSGNMEIDPYDYRAIHIGAFIENILVGCTRLSQPFTAEYFPKGNSKAPDYLQKVDAIEPNSLPASLYLSSDYKSELNNYLNHLVKQKKKKITEIGRLINLVPPGLKITSSLICYAWAICLFCDVDYCFFHTNLKHSKVYEHIFECKRPQEKFTSSKKDKKELLFADIKNPPKRKAELIKSIFGKFKNHQNIRPVYFN